MAPSLAQTGGWGLFVTLGKTGGYLHTASLLHQEAPSSRRMIRLL